MNAWLIVLLPLLLCYAGMTGLSLAMPRHQRQVWPAVALAPPYRNGLRALGTGLLALALLPCIRAWGPSVGVVLWLGYLSAGAGGLVLLLSWRPRSAALLAGVAVAVTVPVLLTS
ncbi:DUF3325 domain-containing protein [Kineobactrum salinum]|uniref:DUF3325 domain-containing protein n=1 Tax=Kineobactrum salinum TaxID=2708301 RepID=A0A6C0TZ86_9GAMM|nr:DUF3325 domain-containing protein [Kineobactrum salinum]QIB65130.1 DUF3325 domain-containing protein [Kineobactrum salinum]